jgi:hypothetical protein
MSRRVVIFIVIIVILAVIIAGYEFIANLSYTRHITLPANMLASSSVDSNSGADNGIIASTSLGTFGLNDPTLMSPASSTADASSWQTYSNAANGYSMRYPSNLSVNADSSGNPVLSFPKDQYFHWPLLDDAKITIVASSSCPTVINDRPDSQPTTLTLNGYSFTRTEGGDVGAGNIYRELAYDTQAGGACYHIDFLDHGANGAGLYVGDQSLIASYDAIHTTDLAVVVGVFNAMVNTFRLTKSVL